MENQVTMPDKVTLRALLGLPEGASDEQLAAGLRALADSMFAAEVELGDAFAAALKAETDDEDDELAAQKAEVSPDDESYSEAEVEALNEENRLAALEAAEAPRAAMAALKTIKRELRVPRQWSFKQVGGMFNAWADQLAPYRPQSGALKGAGSALRQALVATPAAPADYPRHQSRSSGAAKSTRYGNINVNRGAVNTPLLSMVKTLQAKKAHNYQIGTQGGFVVRGEVADRIIPALESKLAIKRAGASTLILQDTEHLEIPKEDSVPEAEWLAIGNSLTAQNQKYQRLVLRPKPLGYLTVLPWRMLNTMPDQAEERIRAKIVTALQRAIDRGCLFGGGAVPNDGISSGESILGLVNMPHVGRRTLGTGNGDQPTIEDLNQAITAIEARDVEIRDPAHIMRAETRGYYLGLNDQVGQPNARVQRVAGGRDIEIDGIKALDSSLIPGNVTLGSTPNTTAIFTGDFSYMEVGYGGEIGIRVLDELYATSLGLGIMAYTYADMVVHYEEAFYVTDGVIPRPPTP